MPDFKGITFGSGVVIEVKDQVARDDIEDMKAADENQQTTIEEVGTQAEQNKTDIINLRNRVGSLEEGDYGEVQIITAQPYSALSTYGVGEQVVHDGQLYECIEAISVPESWNPNKWQKSSTIDKINDAQDKINEVKNNIVVVQDDQPEDEANKIWIKTQTEEYQVPTWQEFQEALANVPGAYKTLTSDDLVNGSWYGGQTYDTSSTLANRVRTKSLIPVKANSFVRYTNPTLKVYIGVAKESGTTTILQNSGWVAVGQVEAIYKITHDGYLYVIAEGSSGLKPADYDCTIDIVSDEVGRLKEDIDEINTAMELSTTQKTTHWIKSTIAIGTGEFVTSTKRIVNESLIGFKTGVSRVTIDGAVAYIYAWDKDGNYLGFYNSDREFSTAGAKYATWNEFDCHEYPDYMFRFTVMFDPASDTITVADGNRVTFHTVDPTLTLAGFPADAKAVGDAINNISPSVSVDDTLSIAGAPADAKAVGDALKNVVTEVDTTLSKSGVAADAKAVGDAINNISVEGQSGVYQTLTSDDFVNGSWYGGETNDTESNVSKRLRVKELIPIKKNSFIRYTNPTLKVYIGVAEEPGTNTILEYIGWVAAGKVEEIYQITHDGYLYVIVEGSAGIQASDYDCIIDIVSDEIGRIKSNINDINTAIEISTTQKTSNWIKSTINLGDGEFVTSTQRIVNITKVGVNTGVNRVTIDGAVAYVYAWDKAGNYLGFYNSDHEFSKLGQKFATYTEFDCSQYPDYLFRFTVMFSPASSSITVEDGARVTFHTTDSTLTLAGVPADSKAVGDAISGISVLSNVDATLSIQGAPADAKAVGDAIANLSVDVDDTLTVAGSPADAKAVGDRVGELEDRDMILMTNKSTNWTKHTINLGNGAFVASSTRIVNTYAVGVSTGVQKITIDGAVAYIYGWDTDGNYLGFYNSDREFSTLGQKFTTWTEFDCTAYPNYVVRLTVMFNPTSDTITTADGSRVTFQTLDDTLSVAGVPADSKAIGDALIALEERVASPIVDVSKMITKDEMELGTWNWSNKASVSTNKRLRIKKLIPVRKNMQIRYINPTLKVYFGVLETATSTVYLQNSGWLSTGTEERTYVIDYDGYMTFIVEGEANRTVDNYDCSVVIINAEFMRNDADITNTGLFKIFRKVGVIGDSLSVGCIYGSPVRNLKYSWPKQIMRESGVPWLNIGTSGQSSITFATDATYGKVQLEQSGNKCQAYLIALIANDEWSSKSVLGTTDDVVDDPDVEQTTFYGAYNRIIQLIKRVNDKAKIFCVTLGVGVESKGYNNAIRWIANEHYGPSNGVFVIEMGLQHRDYWYKEKYGLYQDRYSIDPTHAHYTPVGYRMIATLVMKVMDETIKANQQYFVDVSKIPYDMGDPTPDTMYDSDELLAMQGVAEVEPDTGG